MKQKKLEDYLNIVEKFDWLCTTCNTRHPTKVDKCFVCGSEHSTVFEKQEPVKKRKKTALKGASLKVNV